MILEGQTKGERKILIPSSGQLLSVFARYMKGWRPIIWKEGLSDSLKTWETLKERERFHPASQWSSFDRTRPQKRKTPRCPRPTSLAPNCPGLHQNPSPGICVLRHRMYRTMTLWRGWSNLPPELRLAVLYRIPMGRRSSQRRSSVCTYRSPFSELRSSHYIFSHFFPFVSASASVSVRCVINSQRK